MSKGSGQRPAAVSPQELAAKWAQTFGGRAEGADGRGTVEAATGRLWSASQIESVQRSIDGLRAVFDEPISPTEGA